MINVRIQPEISQETRLAPRIAVIGVGGAGGNAVNNMIETNLQGVEFIVCNSDSQALEHSKASKKVQLGETVTNGLGAGSRPEIGRAAAEENIGDLMELLEGVNMVFITAGMGGGTGTGAAPIIAEAARAKGILTVGVVTKPFHFEGAHRMRSAEDGLKNMESVVDTLIVIPNQNLFRIANEKTTFSEAFRMADGVLQSGVRGVTDLMVMPGLINLDFNDIRNVMEEMGKAMMGTGEAEGEGRAIKAAEAAVNNPLLDDVSMKGAKGVIINITGGYDMTLFEVDEACNHIRDEVDPNANIIFGSTFDDNLEGTMRVSVVATGIDQPMSARGTTTSNQGLNARSTTYMADNKVEAGSATAPFASKSPLATQSVAPYAAREEKKPSQEEIEANYTPTVKTLESSYTIPSAPAEDVSAHVPELPLMSDASTPSSSNEFKLTAQSATPEAKTFPKVADHQSSFDEPAPNTRRPVSLFEKLRSSILPDHESDVAPVRTRAPSVGVSGQTTLKVEASPERAPVVQEETDDLDIPAFLRRQAN